MVENQVKYNDIKLVITDSLNLLFEASLSHITLYLLTKRSEKITRVSNFSCDLNAYKSKALLYLIGTKLCDSPDLVVFYSQFNIKNVIVCCLRPSPAKLPYSLLSMCVLQPIL